MAKRQDRDAGSTENRPVMDVRKVLHAAENMLLRREPAQESNEAPLRKLLGVVEQLSSTHEVDKVLTLAASRIIDIFEAERVFVLDVLPQERFRFRLAVSYKGEAIARPESEVSHAVVREVAEQRKPVLVRDASTDSRFANVSSVRNLQLHSVMAAPLLAVGNLKGVVYADNRRLSGVFGERSLDLLGLFANHIGVAIQNAELFTALNATRAELALAERQKTIGQVAGFVAHEIRNPLASIQLATGLLRDRWQEENVRSRFFEMVPAEIERLNKSVNQILGYSKPTPLVKVPLRIQPLIESALNILTPELSQYKVRVQKRFGADIPLVLADGERLREVFVNLIKNAAEAMQQSPVRDIKITLSRVDESNVELVVEDTGSGIPQDDLRNIFDPFHTRKPFGAGLGLAFCQKFVREHGGTISAANLPGAGAVFRVSLPVYGA